VNIYSLFKIFLILLKILSDKRSQEIFFSAGIINISFPSYLVLALTDGILIRAVISRLNCSTLLAGTERISNRAAVSCEKDRIFQVSLSLPVLPMSTGTLGVYMTAIGVIHTHTRARARILASVYSRLVT